MLHHMHNSREDPEVSYCSSSHFYVAVTLHTVAMGALWWTLHLLLVVVPLGVTLETLNNRGPDTGLAIPMLYPYRDCNSSTLGSPNYELFISESRDGKTSFNGYTTSAPNMYQIMYQDEFSHTYYWPFFNSHDARNSPEYQCYNSVFGLYILFLYNPTVSLVAAFSTPTFFQVFTALPLPSFINLNADETALVQQYVYIVMFQSHSDQFQDGIAISVVHDNTSIAIEVNTDLIALRNAKEELVILKNETSEERFTSLHLFEVLWIEPMTSNCTLTSRVLKNTKITSNKPLSVFTTKVKCNDAGGFSYDSQLVHQMPPVSKWGKNFILDMQQTNIIPSSLKQYLHYEFVILTSSNYTTNITIDYYYLGNQLHPNSLYTETYFTSSDVELRIPVTPPSISDSLSHFHIRASDSILVMYEIYSHSGGNTSYSILLQPTEWYSRQQTVILSHPLPSSEYRFHVGMVIPKIFFDPRLIYVKNVRQSHPPEPLSTYGGYNGEVFNTTDHVVLCLEMTVHNESSNETHLLLQHSNPTGVLGATVYSYAESGTQYAYSNGYILDNSTEESMVPEFSSSSLTTEFINNTSSPPLLETIIGLVLLALGLVVVGVLITTCVTKRVHTKKRNSMEVWLSEPSCDYDYDVFLSFADEDSAFVTKNVYIPLKHKGYSIFWHYEHFRPGIGITENIQRAVRMSRRTVFVCTKHFSQSEFCLQELAYCLDVQRREKTRRIIPIVIEEVFCPKELMEFNQIRVWQSCDMNPEEVEAFIMKLNLGEHVQPHDKEVVETEV